MCVSCGCGQVNDDHGDQRNITMGDLSSAAQAAGTDVQTVARNIQQGMSQGGGRQQQQMGGQGMGGPGQQGQGRSPQPGQQPGMRGRETEY